MRALKFLKENSYDVVRLYINQIGITIFSLVLYFSVSSLNTSASTNTLYKQLLVGISVFAMLFFFALLYTAAWDWGANDKIRIDSGKVGKRAYKGAVIAIFANVLNIILAAGCVISELIIRDGEGFVSQLFRPILLLTNAMYLGVIQVICSSAEQYNIILFESVGYLIAPIWAIAATHIGYTFGMKNIKIFRSSKNKKEEK